jgi:three-Cys-motif partner protein
MKQYSDENPDYWEDYNNLQRVKHDLLKRYLGGWYPILSSWSARIVYIDCHAGRGRHTSGEIGSPLIALETLLVHKSRRQILRNCEIRFYFIEADAENKRTLEQNLASYKNIPSSVFVSVEHADFQKALQGLVDRLNKRGAELAPAFVFVDPYGFKLPGKLLSQLKSFLRCELFITFMWRWVDMAINNPTQEQNMNALFTTSKWRDLRDIPDSDERCEAAIRLLGRQIGGEFLTRVKMLGEHGEIKYVLIHTTGHPKGRELMLQAMWKICPTGGFRVRVNDNPHQEFLIEPTPDLAPLRDWLWDRYSGRTVSVEDIYADLQAPETGTFFLKPHLHEVLKELHTAGEITGPDRLVFSKNPVLKFRAKSSKRPKER